MLCPTCHSDSPQRSRRKDIQDQLAGLARLRPWRCMSCEKRFYAWTVPVGYVQFVHCERCGNFDLRRIARDHGTGSFAWLFRLLRVPAYRCAPCRHRFFSVRAHRIIIPIELTMESRTESHSLTPQ